MLLVGSRILAYWYITADILYNKHINFASATPDELERLAQACKAASFGVK